jgi:hypothetical protein
MTFALDYLHLNTPVIKKGIEMFGKEAIAVYPERITRNPFGSPVVVRWLLSKTRFPYSPQGLQFAYLSSYFKDDNPLLPELFMPTIEEFFFNRLSQKRDVKVFYVGKGKFQPVINKDAFMEITRVYPISRKELAYLFSRASVFYCFDNLSVIGYESALCGCPTVIIPDGSISREDFFDNNFGDDGIAWGEEELPRAIATMDKVRLNYRVAELKAEKQLDEFIKITQEEI